MTLDIETFKSLEKGDVLELGEFFPKLSKEPATLYTLDQEDGANHREFVLTYLGVTIGRVRGEELNGEIKWQVL